MNFDKFAQQLEELNEFFAYLKQRFSAEELSDLDRDVLMDYVRDLYATLRVGAEPSKRAASSAANTKLKQEAAAVQQQAQARSLPLEIVEPAKEPETALVVETVADLLASQQENTPAQEPEKQEEVEAPLVVEIVEDAQAEYSQEAEYTETEEVEYVEAEEVFDTPTNHTSSSPANELQIMNSDLKATQNDDSATRLPEVVFEVVDFEDEEVYTPPPPRFNAEYDDLFAFKTTGELSQKLADSRVEDLHKSMGLNDKFLYINELFGGNSTRFKQAIDHFNTECRDLDDAREYIERELIQTFRWLTPLKTSLAKDFIKLLRRRYLR